MGQDKASLKIGSKTFLQHTCDIAACVATPVVVVAGTDQAVAHCSASVLVVRDTVPFPGPLPALQLGCESLNTHITEDQAAATSVWVTGCDTPFVTPEIITTLWNYQQQNKVQVATLTQDGRDNPLLAVYELRALQLLQAFIDQGEFRATDFLRSLTVARLTAESVPQHGKSPGPATNLNTQDDLNEAFGEDLDRTES